MLYDVQMLLDVCLTGCKSLNIDQTGFRFGEVTAFYVHNAQIVAGLNVCRFGLENLSEALFRMIEIL